VCAQTLQAYCILLYHHPYGVTDQTAPTPERWRHEQMLLPIHPALAMAILAAAGVLITGYAVGMALAVDRLYRITHPATER
jgi:hypothetical protein